MDKYSSTQETYDEFDQGPAEVYEAVSDETPPSIPGRRSPLPLQQYQRHQNYSTSSKKQKCWSEPTPNHLGVVAHGYRSQCYYYIKLEGPSTSGSLPFPKSAAAVATSLKKPITPGKPNLHVQPFKKQESEIQTPNLLHRGHPSPASRCPSPPPPSKSLPDKTAPALTLRSNRTPTFPMEPS
uniref:Uncharacterized protein n=1 Tax=Magallana gigas TaxID=29159 RepID=A0A8W8IGI3_MAGGI